MHAVRASDGCVLGVVGELCVARVFLFHKEDGDDGHNDGETESATDDADGDGDDSAVAGVELYVEDGRGVAGEDCFLESNLLTAARVGGVKGEVLSLAVAGRGRGQGGV